MTTLAMHIEDGKFTYAQIERQGDLAIYRQQRHGSHIQRYEVIVIRFQPAHTFPSGHVKPEGEAYPNSNAWGRDGWTFHTLTEGQAWLGQLASKRMTATEV